MAGKAEARLIYSSISVSPRVSGLGLKGALLFTWLITHCDAQGRALGDPRIVKTTVVPFIDEITTEDIPELLNSMEEAKLISQYKDEKRRLLIQIVDWWDWQTGLLYKGSSRYQTPDNWEDKTTERGENGRFARKEEAHQAKDKPWPIR